MRLGQLARQLEIKPEKIMQFLEKEKKITLNPHPNSKIEDNLVDDISNHFKPTAEVVIVEDNETPTKVEVKEKPATKESKAEVIVEAEPEHIETPKTELEGPKIVGKIDLPNKKEIQIEIDGVVYDHEFLDKKKKDELAELKKQKEIEREEKKKEEAEKKQAAIEKRKLEKERQDLLAREKNNALSVEQERKKALIRKAQEEREKQLEEKRKERQKEHYAKKHAIKAPKKKQTKKVAEQPVKEVIELNQPKETNLLKRFIKWLNT